MSDAVIIGGGVIGASIAFQLACRKIKVKLLEKRYPAAGASGACDGAVFLQTKRPGVHLQMALESSRRFNVLTERLPIGIEFRKSGGLVVIETEAQYEAIHRYVIEQRRNGLEVNLLDAEELRSIEPHLSDRLLGAAHSSMDGKVNPMALTNGFIQAAKALGADILMNTCVTDIEVRGNRVRSVRTNHGEIETEIVINAAGIYAPEIGRMVDLHVPIKPRRGQLLVMEAGPKILSHCLISANYITAKFNPESTNSGDEGVSMDQTSNGTLLLGSTREFVGFDRRNTLSAMKRIAAQAPRILPRLKQMKVIRAFAGLRPYTTDGLPILGEVKAVKGFIMAAGHEGDGIALSPYTGELIAQLVVDGKADIPLCDFSLERF